MYIEGSFTACIHNSSDLASLNIDNSKYDFLDIVHVNLTLHVTPV